jgi:hypothetical protein
VTTKLCEYQFNEEVYKLQDKTYKPSKKRYRQPTAKKVANEIWGHILSKKENNYE